MYPRPPSCVTGERQKRGLRTSFVKLAERPLFSFLRVRGAGMDSDRWQKIQTLFHRAADVPEAEQRVFLESQCAGDPVLVSEIMILLEEDSRGASMLDGDIAHVAHQILSDPASAPAPFKEFGPYRIQ